MSWLNDVGLMMAGVEPSLIEEAKKKKREEERSKGYFLKGSTKKFLNISSLICLLVFGFLALIEYSWNDMQMLVKYIVTCILLIAIMISNCINTKGAEIISIVLIVIIFALIFML